MQTGTCPSCQKLEVLKYGFCSERCRETYRPPRDADQVKPEK